VAAAAQRARGGIKKSKLFLFVVALQLLARAQGPGVWCGLWALRGPPSFPCRLCWDWPPHPSRAARCTSTPRVPLFGRAPCNKRRSCGRAPYKKKTQFWLGSFFGLKKELIWSGYLQKKVAVLVGLFLWTKKRAALVGLCSAKKSRSSGQAFRAQKNMRFWSGLLDQKKTWFWPTLFLNSPRRAPSLGRRTSSLYFAPLLRRRLAFLGVGRSGRGHQKHQHKTELCLLL
jgi:hypothetical protein